MILLAFLRRLYISFIDLLRYQTKPISMYQIHVKSQVICEHQIFYAISQSPKQALLSDINEMLMSETKQMPGFTSIELQCEARGM